MNFLLDLLLQQILIVHAQNGPVMILPMQMVVHMILSHHQ